jgi:hypothetical protein
MLCVATCEDDLRPPSPVKLKPVMASAAMGETPMSPPVILEAGTVEIPVFARIAKVLADRSSTVAVAVAVAALSSR